MVPFVDYNSPVAIRKVLEEKGLSVQKQLGQNFLVNPKARERILEAALLFSGSSRAVWEVGPGLGAMTSGLLERGGRVTAFEVDRGYVKVLEKEFAAEAAAGVFTLVGGDVLKTWGAVLAAEGVPAVFFGNLPYNIAATLIALTITSGVVFPRLVFTVQKEVAKRMAALPGEGDYSGLSVLCAAVYEVDLLFDLSAGNFWPPPAVSSTVVRMVPKISPIPNISSFAEVVRASFASRRKTLRNNLVSRYGFPVSESALATAGIDGERRAETLSPVEFCLLTSSIAS